MRFWTAERKELAVKLFHDGYSAAAAAEALGISSRNVVAGKWHRLGLGTAGRAIVVCKERKHRSSAGGAATKRRKADRLVTVSILRDRFEDETVELTPEQRARAVPLMRLNNKTCRWPYGDPAKPDFCFCGGESVTDKPYCAEHCAVAYGRAAA